MSYNESEMTGLGATNSKWGVCGFTSTIYAMYQMNPAVRPQVINATSGFSVLAEIKTYLSLLRAERSPLLEEITAFTRSFGGKHENFSIESYVAQVGGAVDSDLETILADPTYGIAMPPAAVADYVRRIWQWQATVSEYSFLSGDGDGIIGVTPAAFYTSQMYRGLRHFMYRSGGRIYSWGKSFGSVQQASDWGAGGVGWRVCYVIAVKRP